MAPRDQYFAARKEHAWLLRAEGKTFREIGNHLGICAQTAKQNADDFSRIMCWAMRNMPKGAERSRSELWMSMPDDSYIDD